MTFHKILLYISTEQNMKTMDYFIAIMYCMFLQMRHTMNKHELDFYTECSIFQPKLLFRCRMWNWRIFEFGTKVILDHVFISDSWLRDNEVNFMMLKIQQLI